jgi:hypothetical protein
MKKYLTLIEGVVIGIWRPPDGPYLGWADDQLK